MPLNPKALVSCSYPSQRPISTRSKNPASAKAIKLTRMRPIIRASSRYMWPAACASVPPRGLLAARRRPRRALTVAITADLLKGCLDDGMSSPLMIRVFDVADQIADDFELIDFLVRDYDVREPIFDHDH